MLSEKEKLYQKIDFFRQSLNWNIHDPVNSIQFVNDFPRIDLEIRSFHTPGLCGVAMVGDKVDTIVLNARRTTEEQNFDCSHEIMHLFLHRGKASNFNCFTQSKPFQNSFQEWQANEGAAQFLVPYQDFIPLFSKMFDWASGVPGMHILAFLAHRYGVTERVIELRINSLSYGIDQYRQGIPIDQIELLSRNQQRDRGIVPTNYTAACDFGAPWGIATG